MTHELSGDLPQPSAKIDTSVPHSARIWNYWLGGLELVEPGVVPVSEWRPDPSPFAPPTEAYTFGGVGRKP